MAAAELVVVTPLVIARDSEGHDVYLYKGAEVPENVGADERKRLKDEGFVATKAEAEKQTMAESKESAQS